MDDRFDQEFYRSQWQRVLPVGPDGIQPYVRTAGGSILPAAASSLHRVAAMLAWLARHEASRPAGRQARAQRRLSEAA